jgi:hypothetical protein
MKRIKFLVLYALLLATLPAVSSDKKTSNASIQDLKHTLAQLQAAHTSDEDVATALKKITLGEQLDQATMNSLSGFLHGPLSTEQVYVLQGRSAFLPPPSDSPAPPAPDPARQKAILGKAADYVTKTLSQSPRVTATRTSARFQDGVADTHASSSDAGKHFPGANAAVVDKANLYMRYLGPRTTSVENERGVEKAAVEMTKTHWGANGQVSESGASPLLSVILTEAAAANKLNFVRWELIDGKQIAVFAFAVDKKKGGYTADYCCFPTTTSQGSFSNRMANADAGISTDWKPFKTTVGYHGELFVDPDTGVVVRLNTHTEFKPSDFVHQEDIRIDYGPVTLDGKTWLLPSAGFSFNEVVPYGDDYTHHVSIRHTLFIVNYKNYQLADAAVK